MLQLSYSKSFEKHLSEYPVVAFISQFTVSKYMEMGADTEITIAILSE